MKWFLAFLALCAIASVAVCALGTLHSRGKERQRARHRTAQADEIALSMQFGGASDFHDFPLRTNLEQDRG